MPYYIRKVPGKNCYSVRKRGNVGKRRVFSKCTSLSRAKKQMRLLYAVENPSFVPRKTVRRPR
jgi:hypothetical protein